MKADYDARVTLGNLEVEDLKHEDTPRTVRLRLRKDYGISVGDRITALAELMPLSGLLRRAVLIFGGICIFKASARLASSIPV